MGVVWGENFHTESVRDIMFKGRDSSVGELKGYKFLQTMTGNRGPQSVTNMGSALFPGIVWRNH